LAASVSLCGLPGGLQDATQGALASISGFHRGDPLEFIPSIDNGPMAHRAFSLPGGPLVEGFGAQGFGLPRASVAWAVA